MHRLSAIVLGLIILPGFCLAEGTVAGNPGLSKLVAGEVAMRAGDYEAGVQKTLAGLPTINSRHQRSKAFNNLCAGYLALRQYSKALEACDQALNLSGKSWRIYSNRALVLMELGRLSEARLTLEAGLALHPQSPTLARVSTILKDKVQRDGVITYRPFNASRMTAAVNGDIPRH